MIPSPEQHKAALDAAIPNKRAMKVAIKAAENFTRYDTPTTLVDDIVRAYLSALPEQQRPDTAELIALGMWQVAMDFGKSTGSFTEDLAIRVSGGNWHQYLPDAEKLIALHRAAPPAGESS